VDLREFSMCFVHCLPRARGRGCARGVHRSGETGGGKAQWRGASAGAGHAKSTNAPSSSWPGGENPTAAQAAGHVGRKRRVKLAKSLEPIACAKMTTGRIFTRSYGTLDLFCDPLRSTMPTLENLSPNCIAFHAVTTFESTHRYRATVRGRDS